MGRQCKYCGIISNAIYNCKWNSYSENQTKIAEKCWWCCLLLVFTLGSTWLICWSVFSNDYNDFNWFLYENTGFWFGWGLCIMILFIIVGFYLFVLFCSGVCLIAQGQQKQLHICHKISVIVALILCIGGFIAVDMLWGEEYYSVNIALQMMNPFLHISLLFVFTLSSWLMFYEIMRMEKWCVWISVNIGVMIFLIFLFLFPLFITSPCIGHDLKSVPKPLLIAHRLGTAKKAPENTILAYEEGSRSCETFAVETDVSISIDGVPFLMHDTRNLKRTTNVESVFPNKSDQHASLFTWDELQQLDAGSWFLQEDPFLTVKSLSHEMKDKIRKQKIPSLYQVAKIIGQHSLIFDLYQPVSDNPYHLNYTELAMEVLLESGLPQNQVLWLPSQDRGIIHSQAPGFHLVSTASSLEFIKANNITIVNLNYLEETTKEISTYLNNNISVILYKLQAPWLFSYAWCQGTTFVTTDNCEKLSKISSPSWTLTKAGYIAIWVVSDVVSFLVVLLLFVIQYRRSDCTFIPWLSYVCRRETKYDDAMEGIVDNINLDIGYDL